MPIQHIQFNPLNLVKPVKSSQEEQTERLTLGRLTQDLEKGGLDIEKMKQNILATKQAAEREAQALAIQQQSGGDPEKTLRGQAAVGVGSVKDLQDFIESQGRINNLNADNQRQDDAAKAVIERQKRDDQIKRIELEGKGLERTAKVMQDELDRVKPVEVGGGIFNPVTQQWNMPPKAPTADNSVTPFEVWRRQNPDAPIADWLKLEGQSKPNASADNRAASEASNKRLVDTILSNPNLYDDLTAKEKAEVAPDLAAKGFSGFGKPLPQAAITKLAESKSAIASLRDLRGVLVANEQYIGPLAGLQVMNPYSEGRKAQSDIDRVRQRVGKALEGGVLRKEDEEKYKKILATLRDTPSTAIYKVDQMIEDLARDIDIYVKEQVASGRKVGNSASPKGGDGTTDAIRARLGLPARGNASK